MTAPHGRQGRRQTRPERIEGGVWTVALDGAELGGALGIRVCGVVDERELRSCVLMAKISVNKLAVMKSNTNIILLFNNAKIIDAMV